MDIFNSQWLLNMLAKSSKTPQGRILSLFDILHDWLTAPDIQVKISSNSTALNSQLSAYFTEQAIAIGASNPTILAEHIVLIARNAAQQELNHPGSGSLAHAKKAASALILAQTQKEWPLLKTVSSKSAVYGIAASVFLFFGIASIWLPELLHSNHQKITQAKAFNANNIRVETVIAKQADTKLTAIDAATMYAKYEQMRNGTCQFPEVLQIPDKDKAIYLENVVGGKLPTDLADLAIANSYLEKIRCNFTPMLMANSKS
ncbi:MAG: hypothetical protein Q7T42_08070 [Methylotenera sp.]|uniref:hypothetical protein n=1 Tax=Methylotenera sp. TaxID=2051956 RepID=UPI00271BB77E|nr:hypothetical protein [Methylotenera sp.]MDO9393909.1 hypothetical protein [Methylotenera sp.]MDP1521554.1 hypothetical protein [Methylotenera sp.]MDP3817521.1 hypothetical protein [Methylotenera sp.]